jgi:hypothetical protein
MNKFFVVILALLILGCASKKTMKSSGIGDTRTKSIEYIDNNTYLLLDQSTDITYGFEESNPVKVGGSRESSGPLNERRFLNALLGPNGEDVQYFRRGSCCHFKTPNGLMNNTGLLDVYRVFWTGSKDTLNIYINMYDSGDLLIPVGFTAKQKVGGRPGYISSRNTLFTTKVTKVYTKDTKEEK